MAQFKITETDKRSFFTDNTLERPNRNNSFGNKTVLARPRTDEEIFDANYQLQTKFRNSISEMTNTMEDMDKVTQDFYSISGIYYNMNEPIPEIDNQFDINPTQLDPFIASELQTDFGGYVRNNAHLRAKRDYINKKIEEWFQANPNERGGKEGGFRDYNYYLSLRSQELADLEKEVMIQQKYNDGSSFLPSAAGNVAGIFSDPVIAGSVVASIAAGGSMTTIGGIIRMSLAEAAIGAGFEIPIQLSAVSYNKQLGSDYGWKDASKAIALAGFGGALGTAVIGGTMKTFFSGYSKILRTTNFGKAKALAKEIDKLVDEAPVLDEKYAEKVMQYIYKNIDTFNMSEKRALLETISNSSIRPNPAAKLSTKILEEEELIEQSNPLENSPRGKQEHIERLNKAGESLLTGENKLDNNTRTPIDYTKSFDQDNNVYREVRLDPDEIEVEPDVFQFKTQEIDPTTGVSPKLKNVTVWDQDAANVVMVFEYADGRKVIADGHQRLALAKRIKKLGKQKPYLLATVRREVDGHTPEETMVAAMMLNVHQGTASAADVAKILKLKPDYIESIKGKISTRSVLWENAKGLSKLSPEAWQYYLNNSVPDRIAAIVGDMVDDPDLHIQVMDFIAKTKFDNEQQIRLAVQDILNQGVSTKEIQDLFGTQNIKELLFQERALILDKAIRDLKKDKTIAGFLISNEDKIVKKGKNKLDSEFNKKALEESSVAIEKIVKLANMKGEISDELTRAARLYKDGNQQEAIRTFKETITTAIRDGSLDGITPSGSQRSTISEGYTQKQTNIPKETETNIDLKNSEDVHNGETQYDTEWGSVQNAMDIIFGDQPPPPKKIVEKVDLQNKTLAEISEIDDDILKSQADELINHPEIIKLREESVGKKTTLDEAGGSFDDAWKEKRGWNKIVDDLYGKGAELKNKELTVFIGLPASGKSTIAASQQKQLGAIIIDSDFVKEHPNLAKEYAGGVGAGAVHDESKFIQELILEKAMENGDNIIVPIVGSSGRSIDKLLGAVKAYDYSLVVKYVEVDEATAITRNIKRINSSGRFVDPQYIKESYQGALQNYNRGKEVANGYEKINLEGPRPVTKEISGAAQTHGRSGQSNVGEIGTEEVREFEEIINNIDKEYDVLVDFTPEGKPIFQKPKDVLNELNTEKKAIDFLEGCPGLR